MQSVVTNITKGQDSYAISATATSFSATCGDNDKQNNNIWRVVNAGSSIAFIRWGVGTQTAILSDVPILPGTTEQFNVGYADTLAAICASTQTTTVYFTPVQGI